MRTFRPCIEKLERRDTPSTVRGDLSQDLRERARLASESHSAQIEVIADTKALVNAGAELTADTKALKAAEADLAADKLHHQKTDIAADLKAIAAAKKDLAADKSAIATDKKDLASDGKQVQALDAKADRVAADIKADRHDLATH
jgi:uncharacterized protein (DUF3084 family)